MNDVVGTGRSVVISCKISYLYGVKETVKIDLHKLESIVSVEFLLSD